MNGITYQFKVFYSELNGRTGEYEESDCYALGEGPTLKEVKEEADFYGCQIENPIIRYYERREIK